MENASKAILIAGGVLIALMLISIGVYIWNTGRASSASAEKRRVASIIQEQNTKFSQYIGEIYGSEVENCIRRVVAYNNQDKKNQITVSLDVGAATPVLYNSDQHVVNEITASNIIKTNISLTNRNDLYIGEIITNDETGMIETINFVKK